MSKDKLAEALRQCIACHEEPGCPALDVARAALAAYEASLRELECPPDPDAVDRALEAEAKAEPAEPVAYVDRASLLWLTDKARTPEARIGTDLYKTAPGDGWVGVHLATPAAPAPHPDTKDAERIQHFEDMANKGFCPSLVFDDDGRWAVSYSGAAPVPEPGGHQETVYISVEVAPNLWRHSVREAIDAAIAASKGGEA